MTLPHHQFWPERRPHRLEVPATSLWHNLKTSAERYPEKAALVYFNQVTTYAELASQVEALAGALQAREVRSGDRVLLCMQNTPQLVVAHFAILRANAVVIPVNPMNRAAELKHYIVDADARLAVTTSDLAGELAAASNALGAGEGLQHLIVSQLTDTIPSCEVDAPAMASAWRNWLTSPYALPKLNAGAVHEWLTVINSYARPTEHVAGSGDMALLPYTSGTTGLPKGCIHDHAGLMHNAMAWNLWFGATSESVMLAAAPMFHITGIVAVLHAAVLAGATLVVMPRWDRDVAAYLIERWKVTDWINIPTMVIDLLASPRLGEFDLSSLGCIGGGGAAMPQAVAQQLLERCRLTYIEAYGLTETAAPSHANPPSRPKQQCLGIPFISTDARVVNPETLKQLPPGEGGEIVIHGPQVFQGYWKQPEATAAAFVDLEGRRFFRTGDIGRVDEEGYFFMTDRLKRMINASGYKVWPAEVEMLLFKHPAVQEACVIATRDAYRGESVKAVIVRRPTHLNSSGQEIITWCRENMAAYKVPRQVEFVDALPKNASGKIMWRLLQEANDD
jgi:fatty-acyl-CoA synthase